MVIGRVVKPQGIRGQLKVESLADDVSYFLDLVDVYIGDELNARAVLAARVDVSGVFLAVEGVDTRDAAEALRGALLSVPRDAVCLPEGRWLIEELKGLRVVDEKGELLGVLDDVLQYGAADVYVVEGARPLQFPALKRVIISVDVEGGMMTLNRAALDEVAVYGED